MRSKRRNGEATSGSENFSLLFSLLALLKDKNEKTRERERERLADSSSHLHAMYRTFLPSLPLSLNSPNQKMNSTRANQDIALRAARTLREMEALIFVLHALPVDWGLTPCLEMRQVDYMAATLFVVRVYDFMRVEINFHVGCGWFGTDGGWRDVEEVWCTYLFTGVTESRALDGWLTLGFLFIFDPSNFHVKG